MTKAATALQRITKFVKANKISEMNQLSKRKLYLKDGQLMRTLFFYDNKFNLLN